MAHCAILDSSSSSKSSSCSLFWAHYWWVTDLMNTDNRLTKGDSLIPIFIELERFSTWKVSTKLYQQVRCLVLLHSGKVLQLPILSSHCWNNSFDLVMQFRPIENLSVQKNLYWRNLVFPPLCVVQHKKVLLYKSGMFYFQFLILRLKSYNPTYWLAIVFAALHSDKSGKAGKRTAGGKDSRCLIWLSLHKHASAFPTLAIELSPPCIFSVSLFWYSTRLN